MSFSVFQFNVDRQSGKISLTQAEQISLFSISSSKAKPHFHNGEALDASFSVKNFLLKELPSTFDSLAADTLNDSLALGTSLAVLLTEQDCSPTEDSLSGLAVSLTEQDFSPTEDSLSGLDSLAA